MRTTTKYYIDVSPQTLQSDMLAPDDISHIPFPLSMQ